MINYHKFGYSSTISHNSNQIGVLAILQSPPMMTRLHQGRLVATGRTGLTSRACRSTQFVPPAPTPRNIEAIWENGTIKMDLGFQHVQLSRICVFEIDNPPVELPCHVPRYEGLCPTIYRQIPTSRPRPKGRTRSTCIFAGCTLQVVEAALCAESSVVVRCANRLDKNRQCTVPNLWGSNHVQSLRISWSLVDLGIFGPYQNPKKKWGPARWLQPRFCKRSRLQQPKCHSIFPDHNFGSSHYPWSAAGQKRGGHIYPLVI